MIVADTCVWIEALLGSGLGVRFKASLRNTANLVVPTIIQLELWKWTARELNEEEADRVIALTRSGHVMPLDETIALTAAELSMRHRLALADAIVYATARLHDAELLTCDAHFRHLPGVKYIAKTS